MIQLSSILYLAIFTFGIIGYLRGFDKELIALAGIVLSIFTLVQFNTFFTSVAAGAGNPNRTLFYFQAFVILTVTFFAYQTPPGRFVVSGGRRARDRLQSQLLGGLAGGFNGYMVFGTLWYYLDEKGYPLDSITPPTLGTSSADLIDALPLTWLLQGNLLTLLVIGLFLFILIAII